MELLSLYNFGERGVNVDKSDLHVEDNELRQAQNAIQDPLGVSGGIKNRPGLIEFNAEAASDSILGGIGVPLINLKTGTHFLYIGRGPVT